MILNANDWHNLKTSHVLPSAQPGGLNIHNHRCNRWLYENGLNRIRKKNRTNALLQSIFTLVPFIQLCLFVL